VKSLVRRIIRGHTGTSTVTDQADGPVGHGAPARPQSYGVPKNKGDAVVRQLDVWTVRTDGSAVDVSGGRRPRRAGWRVGKSTQVRDKTSACSSQGVGQLVDALESGGRRAHG